MGHQGPGAQPVAPVHRDFFIPAPAAASAGNARAVDLKVADPGILLPPGRDLVRSRCTIPHPLCTGTTLLPRGRSPQPMPGAGVLQLLDQLWTGPAADGRDDQFISWCSSRICTGPL